MSKRILLTCSTDNTHIFFRKQFQIKCTFTADLQPAVGACFINCFYSKYIHVVGMLCTHKQSLTDSILVYMVIIRAEPILVSVSVSGRYCCFHEVSESAIILLQIPILITCTENKSNVRLLVYFTSTEDS